MLAAAGRVAGGAPAGRRAGGGNRRGEADVAQAEADLRTARLNLGYTEIPAPIDGYVGNRYAQVGAYVATGTDLLSVVPARGLWVDANFKEDQLARMRPGRAGDDRRRRAARAHVPRPCGEPGAGDRRGVQRHSAAERHRQFHQDRPARAGAHPCSTAMRRSSACCGRGCRPPVSVTTRPADAVSRGPRRRRARGQLLPFAVMCVGMFVALLDIQIVASSLQDIGGGLSAAQDEISWVQTAYLIAEIIMIPLSGWLTRVFSTRWLFAGSALGFTLASMLCGLAWNIDSMIVFRALQGMLGASMIPTVFTSSFHYFQGQRRVYAAAVIGTIASIAPTLGPVIGGWITDTLNWHWLFYINLVPGPAGRRRSSPLLVDIDEPDLSLLRAPTIPASC